MLFCFISVSKFTQRKTCSLLPMASGGDFKMFYSLILPISVCSCQRCCLEDPILDVSKDTSNSWQTIRGKFISVIGANITCKCAKSRNGISPNAHMGDGYFDLILIRKTSRFQYLRHMLRIANRGDLVSYLLACNF